MNHEEEALNQEALLSVDLQDSDYPRRHRKMNYDQDPTWECANGTTWYPRDMEIGHLANTVALMERNAERVGAEPFTLYNNIYPVMKAELAKRMRPQAFHKSPYSRHNLLLLVTP